MIGRPGKPWLSKIGHLPVAAIDTALVPEAYLDDEEQHRGGIRERIEAVLDAGRIDGLREGDNPARWKGHFEDALPKPSKVRPVKHHAALAHKHVAAFIRHLRSHDCMAAKATELLIATATRTSEAIAARWEEFDLSAGRWTIPGRRITTGKDHQIPLSESVLALLRSLPGSDAGEFLFPGVCATENRSPTWHLLKLLERMGMRYTITRHGFCSTFRDWAAEHTIHPSEVAPSTTMPAAEYAWQHVQVFRQCAARYRQTWPITGRLAPTRL